MLKNILPFITILIVLFSCMTVGFTEKETQLFAEWSQQNKKQNLSLGERVYDKKFDLIYTSIITGLSELGFSIKNTERLSGYILAEGPIPLSLDEETRLGEEMVKELNKISPKIWYVTPGNSTHAVTITTKQINDNQVRVKIRISIIDIRTNGNYVSTSSSIYPPILEEEFRNVWDAIERQIFIDENTN